MKTTIKSILLLVAASSSLCAATINGTSFVGGIITGGVLLNGVAATPGQVNANFGFFNSGFDIANAVSTTNYASLFANFNIVSTADVGSTAGIYGEDYAGVFETGGFSFTTNANSIGRTIHAFYTGGSALSAASIANGYALISSGQNITLDGFPPTDYVMPVSGTLVGTNSGSSFTTAVFTAPNSGNVDVTAPALNLLVVPEPSAALLGAIGALSLLRRRRI
jgi:hypothetical protein